MMTHSPEVSKFDLPGDLDSGGVPQEWTYVLYGHTHVPDIREKEGVLWVNPGHLKAHDRRGYPLSYALIHLTPPLIDVKILSLDNRARIIQYCFYSAALRVWSSREKLGETVCQLSFAGGLYNPPFGNWLTLES